MTTIRWPSEFDEIAELEMLYQTAPVGLCLVDRDMRFRRINERLAKINGQPVHHHIGATVREILPDFADAVEARYRQVIETGKSIEGIEMSGAPPSDPDVEHTWLISDHPVFAHGGAVTGIVTVVQDISLRKSLENEIRNAERRLAAAHRIAKVAVWEWDIAGDRMWWSDEIYSVFEIDEDETAPSFDNLTETVHPDDRSRVKGLLKSALSSGAITSLDYRVMVGGQPRIMHTAVELERGPDGVPLRLIGTSRDISDEYRREQDSTRRRIELEGLLAESADEIARLRAEIERTRR